MFVSLPVLQIFATIGINHASAMVMAWFNKDFYCSEVNLSAMSTKPLGKNGTFLNLDYEMSQSLLQIALDLLSQVRADERDALEKQREKKRVKKETMLKRRLDAATREYVDKLYYREMYNSAACWRTCAQVNR